MTVFSTEYGLLALRFVCGATVRITSERADQC